MIDAADTRWKPCLLAARAGWRIVERDIDYRPRAGRSKVTGTVRGTVRAVRDMSVVLAR